MHIHRLNKPLFELDVGHPARRFLESFVECRKKCVGRELDGVDQQWWSTTENQIKTFSSFAYEHLAFDIELDGWLSNSTELTDSERAALNAISHIESLMLECRETAQIDNNPVVVELVDLVLYTMELWKHCIRARVPER